MLYTVHSTEYGVRGIPRPKYPENRYPQYQRSTEYAVQWLQDQASFLQPRCPCSVWTRSQCTDWANNTLPRSYREGSVRNSCQAKTSGSSEFHPLREAFPPDTLSSQRPSWNRLRRRHLRSTLSTRCPFWTLRRVQRSMHTCPPRVPLLPLFFFVSSSSCRSSPTLPPPDCSTTLPSFRRSSSSILGFLFLHIHISGSFLPSHSFSSARHVVLRVVTSLVPA